MSTISAGKLLTNAMVHLADRTGGLIFQTNGTTTALTLDSAQNASFAGDVDVAGGVTITGNLTVNGTTTSFGDNDKIVLGAGQDLQIYHDGSNSYIDDQGTGRLYIRANDHITFTNAAGTETYANFASNGAVGLRYDNSTKLVTTATGVETTGTISVNGAYTLPTADGSADESLVTDGAGNLSFTKVKLTPVVITANTTAVAGNFYYLDSAGITLTLPATPTTGDQVGIADVAGDTTHTIGRNASNIMSDSSDLEFDIAYKNFVLTYTGPSVGWAFSG